MAEKGFGVKEINLIGPSGTPTITSPNNLNLNAVNVAISTNVSIGGTLSVTGNVSIGGTLTYEDVTNIDSVGLVTAREGVFLPNDKNISLGTGNDMRIYSSASGLNNSFIKKTGTGPLNFDFQGDFLIRNTAGSMRGKFTGPLGAVELYHTNTKRFETTSTGASVTGTLSATTFSGSGASLTNLPVSDSDIQVAYNVTANGSSAYNFSGNGSPSGDNPDLYLIRGQKYRFINNSGGSHPFEIRVSNGGSAYSTGVTNNGASSGNIDFAPTFNSPAQLVYQCTSHGGMVGNIYLRDAAGGNTNVGVTTFANITANNINGNVDINVGTGEADIYSTGSGDQLSLRLLNSDTTSGNKIGIYFGPCNNVAGAYIKGVAESDFTSTANRDAGLEFGTRLDGNFLAPLKIKSNGIVTKPLNPTFSAKGTTDAISAQSPLPYDSTDYNIGNHYSTSTYKFTCPVDGYYYVTCHVVPTNYSTGGNNVELYVKDNSGNRYFLDRKVKDSSYSTNNFSVGGSRIIYQTSGSTLWVEFNAISGSPTLEGSSHFGIMLMA